MESFIAIHAHFYQPPRENPWLEAIETQDSAYPYHDWNERITAECYAPVGAARILDGDGRIGKILNTYSKISFNFGPTLLAYLADHQPAVLEGILAADRISRDRFSGHGAALAQPYNHMILPLANRRDKETQILWGIDDFTRRFGRFPEGMWLAETAVDVETLEILAAHGIKFTVLAPHQAKRVRPVGDKDWHTVEGALIDPTRAYRHPLSSGTSIDIFFYDGPISRAVAFEQLLTRGENLAHRLLGAFSDERDWPQLVHIATDGETYGHHHRHGEMALAYALDYIESQGQAQLTIYGEYLERFPPTHEVEIIEDTSWSCAHGIERWRSDCGCNSGGRPEWNQSWRAPLREALDWLRDSLAPGYESLGARYLVDPWEARNDYLSLVLDRSPASVEAFLAKHAQRQLTASETRTVLVLLELQRQSMLMYTSCGWFFDELTGIETVQILQYASRMLQLAGLVFEDDFEEPFLTRLEKAKSNQREFGNGRKVYEKTVRPAVVDLEKVTAHFAVNSLFNGQLEGHRVYCYRVEVEECDTVEVGKARFVAGRVRVTSEITHNSADMSFAVAHLGDHNVSAGAHRYQGQPMDKLLAAARSALRRADFPDLIRQLDQFFGESTYSLGSLFRDAQSRIVPLMLDATLREVDAEYEKIYERQQPLMRFFGGLRLPVPRVLRVAAESVLSARLRRTLGDEHRDFEQVRDLLEEVKAENLQVDEAGIAYDFEQVLNRRAALLQKTPEEIELIEELNEVAALVGLFPFEIRLWKVQNVFYELLQSMYPEAVRQAAAGEMVARGWVHAFEALGEKLSVRVDSSL